MPNGHAAVAFSTLPAEPVLRRWLERLAVLGLLVHALFLSISMAGMQIGLGVSAGSLLLVRLTGRKVWARSALDVPCLLLCGAAVSSLGLATLAGSPPVGWHEATLWRSILSAPIVLSVLELRRWPGEAGQGAPRKLALVALCVWAVASLVPSAVAWVQYATGFDPLYALGLRATAVHAKVPIYQDHYAATGFFHWYQRLAHNLTPPLCVAAAVAVHGKVGPRLRGLLGLSALAAAAAVVLTLSRLAWGALLLSAFLVAAFGSRTRRWAIPLVLAGGVAMALHPGVRVRLAHLAAPGINDDRRAIWSVCASMVKEHPLTGVGWGNLPRRSAALYDALVATYPAPLPRAWCHDSFFSAWAEGGPLLCGALVLFWVLLFRGFWRWSRSAPDELARAAATGGLAALAAMFANSLGHDILYSSEAMYGLGFALAVAAALARGGEGAALAVGKRGDSAG
ncbi:MAG TPA: O-antigen ligase family protein [Anaeromyxobacteraceae bacterium]|nr:O-antigen ligase family protein [Anaeromyxobacteraceae bacterium]